MWAAERYYLMDRHVNVAVNLTYIAYYSDPNEFKMSTGSPPSKSYSWRYKMATVSIVEQLLEIASNHVSIGTVYSDAKFDSVNVIHAIEEAGISISS